MVPVSRDGAQRLSLSRSAGRPSASEDEVISVFLQAELDSERWATQLATLLGRDGVDSSIVTNPNLQDAGECAYRASLLDRHRGWLRRDGLFNGFPHDVDWSRVALTPDEVLAIRYIDWDWWLEVSDRTREPREAARRIRAKGVPVSTAEWHEPTPRVSNHRALRASSSRSLIQMT